MRHLFRSSPSLQIARLRLAFSTKQPGSDTLSSTVTQGVIEENKPHTPGKPKPVPKPTHPNRNMEVPAQYPNEVTAEHHPDQVPEMPGGGKYPDPLTDEVASHMVPGPANTRVHGVRPEADLLSEDIKATSGQK